MKPVILFYNVPDKKISSIKPVLSLMGITVKTVGDDEIFDTVGYIAYPDEFDNKRQNQSDIQKPDMEFMLLCGIEPKAMDSVLGFMRKNKQSIALKAMLTDTNKDWSLIRLINEINAERIAIKAQQGYKRRGD